MNRDPAAAVAEPLATHAITVDPAFDHYCDRAHRLTPAAGPWARLLRGLKDALEATVVRHSVHGDPMVYDARHFAWVPAVEADWRKVRAELDAVMVWRDQMPSFQDILKEVDVIQCDSDWKTFFLAGIGMDCTANAVRCPETMKLLARIPGMTTAFFSILSPGKHIPPHRGAYNGLLRLHLALQVPEPREQVRIRIGNRICRWQEGRALIFDDTFNHEVWNDTAGYRVVLFIDFARPLHQPWDWLNRRFLAMGTFAPFLREANRRQKQWQLAFWKDRTVP
ncbi:MAG: aspartyl/asparaginyl beta-hydroxylase domain-containing protein [Rhodocyclaceae bacterium]|nr:aspartyl/asparaginyl beta-hydroxylase domain-containing protein [Rhodocyclaceae bacterium]